jgi:sugar fermentation stimulation protein A
MPIRMAGDQWLVTSMKGAGIYHLVLRTAGRQRLRIGALGWGEFRAGYYGYTGSARAGFAGRVGRHLRAKKKLRWHIDYLLARARITEVWLKGGRAECEAHRRIGRLAAGEVCVTKFGSSDCSCASHLWRYSRRPEAPAGWRQLVIA